MNETRTDDGRWTTDDGIVLPTSTLAHQSLEFGHAKAEFARVMKAHPPLSWIDRLVSAHPWTGVAAYALLVLSFAAWVAWTVLSWG